MRHMACSSMLGRDPCKPVEGLSILFSHMMHEADRLMTGLLSCRNSCSGFYFCLGALLARCQPDSIALTRAAPEHQ